jgi:hypothetical protein
MNRNGNETESFAGNFVASDEQGLFFEVPLSWCHPNRVQANQEGELLQSQIRRARGIRGQAPEGAERRECRAEAVSRRCSTTLCASRLARAAELAEPAFEENLTTTSSGRALAAYPHQQPACARSGWPHSRMGSRPSSLPAHGSRHIAGTAWSSKRYLNIELLKDQQMRGAITA